MQPPNILLVEDDPSLNAQLADILRSRDFCVDQCHDGEEGLARALSQQHQLILLDVMLPGRDGFSLLGILRKSSQIPVIMLTAKGAEEERIKGFSQGVDDYLAKPFSVTELLLRIEAILRRCYADRRPEAAPLLDIDGLEINRVLQSATARQQVLDLTPIQFELLWILMLHQGEVLSKAFLYQAVLRRAYGEHDRSIDMHLSRLRRKLLDSGWPGERLRTVHGRGYCLI
jgi:two-component system response regulator PfeR